MLLFFWKPCFISLAGQGPKPCKRWERHLQAEISRIIVRLQALKYFSIPILLAASIRPNIFNITSPNGTRAAGPAGTCMYCGHIGTSHDYIWSFDGYIWSLGFRIWLQFYHFAHALTGRDTNLALSIFYSFKFPLVQIWLFSFSLVSIFTV